MIKNLLNKNEFAKNVLTLMTGSVIAQAIPILLTPVLTRLYSPEDFGLFALYTAIVSLVMVAATGRYELAIVLPKRDDYAINIVFLSMFISILIGLIVLLLIAFFGSYLIDVLSIQTLDKWLYLIPLLVVLGGIYQSLNYWSVRKKKYARLSACRAAQSVSNGGLSVVLGLASLGAVGLVISNFVGTAVSVLILIKQVINNDLHQKKTVKLTKIIALYKRYSSFLKFGLPALLTSSFASQSLLFLVSAYLDNIILGFVGLILRIVSIPTGLIGQSLGEVFYQNLSKTKKYKSYEKIAKFAFKLIAYSIFLYSAAYVFLVLFFVDVFGVQWAPAVKYIKYFIIVAAFSFVFAPLTMLFNYFEIQKYNFIWQLLWLISNIVIFLLYKNYNWSVDFLLIIYCFKQSLLYLVGIILFLLYAKRISL